MAKNGETPSVQEVRDLWVKEMSKQYETTDVEISRGKSSQELAGEAFDRMIGDKIATTIEALWGGMKLVTT